MKMSISNCDNSCDPKVEFSHIHTLSAMTKDGEVVGEPFDLTEARYDQTTFVGRLERICDLFNPLQLLASEEEIAEAQKVLSDYKLGDATARAKSSDELWAARALVEARVHPDTGVPVPRLLCFAAYAPMQPPLIIGL
jgi:hypothetical protein